MATLGEALVAGLEAYGIDTVFGIPGVHTVELYGGLAGSSIRHVTPRHEQGAGFMADGYFRATGRVAAAFVITGPGVTNILTPMAQAYADSIPMLVVSSVNRTQNLGMGGDLHEIRNQGLIAAQAAAFSHTITHPDQLGTVLARAFAVFHGARPRPVHIQVPLDLFGVTYDELPTTRSAAAAFVNALPGPSLDHATDLLNKAERPLILLGGGAAMLDVRDLASDLDAPVVMTTNARGKLDVGHPLAIPASPSLDAVRQLIKGSDVVLAIATEMGRTDYDMYDNGDFEVPGTLIRVDIDQEHLTRGAAAHLSICGDALSVLSGLSARLDVSAGTSGSIRAEDCRSQALEEIGPKYRSIVGFLDTIRDTLPEAPIVCDSTQAAYAGNLYYAAPSPRKWFNAATGYGALGYGLPAAVGAARGLDAPVICICGDGGLQFSLAELGTAVEEQLPLILLVWNNQGYGEIKDYMVARQISPVGVDLHTPDFVAIAKAYGCEAMLMEDLADLPGLLTEATTRKGPTVIEIPEEVVLRDL
ncbi:MAG: 5-guanidino-2-oxopentanoate decarboxylase [Pseudomonadota bacterium]